MEIDKNKNRRFIKKEKDEIEQLKIDLRIVILTKWLYVLVAIMGTLIIGFFVGYFNGMLDIYSAYEIVEIKEVLKFK